LRDTARCSERTATAAVVSGRAEGAAILARSEGITPMPTSMPPSLAKNDLREQCGLTVDVRFKFVSEQRRRTINVKQNFLIGGDGSAYKQKSDRAQRR
jgi:hypothetical protein